MSIALPIAEPSLVLATEAPAGTKRTWTARTPAGALIGSYRTFEQARAAVDARALQTNTTGVYRITPPDRIEVNVMGFRIVTTPPPADPGQVWLQGASASWAEGTQQVLTFRRAGGSSGAVAVDWAATGPAAASMTPSSGTVNWANGDLGDKPVNVTVALVNADLAASIALSNPRSTSGGRAPTMGNPSQSITITDTPPPPQEGNWTPGQGANTAGMQALFGRWADFMQIAKRNWNHGGHSIDDRFTGNQGRWDYLETTSEPWLFDRPSTFYRYYRLTNDAQWLTQFLSDFDWYRARIGSDGIFIPKGFGDTKYSYTLPYLYYQQAGNVLTAPMLTQVQNIYNAYVADFSNNESPSAPDASLWTEREVGLALDAAVGHFQITGNAASLTRAQAMVNMWDAFCDFRNAGAPLVTYTRHEGGGPGGSSPQDLVTSLWMSALYFQAARRYLQVAPAASTQVYTQASEYFDFITVNNGFFAGEIAHPQYAGLTFPSYMASTWSVSGGPVGDAGYDFSQVSHAVDVCGMLMFCKKAKTILNQSTAAVDTRIAQMVAAANTYMTDQTRTTLYLPRYRVNPPRLANWVTRGFDEIFSM